MQRHSAVPVPFDREVWASGAQGACTLWEGNASQVGAFSIRILEISQRLGIDFDPDGYMSYFASGSVDGESWSNVDVEPNYPRFTTAAPDPTLRFRLATDHGVARLRIGIATKLDSAGGPTVHGIKGTLYIFPLE